VWRQNTQKRGKKDTNFEPRPYSAFKPGASGLPYYCTPPVFVPVGIQGLAVWWHNKNKKDREVKYGFLGLTPTKKEKKN